MKTNPKHTLAALLAAFTVWPLTAQTVATPPAKPSPEEEAIVLTPFEVATTKDTGYQAMQTLAGTRIRTDLKDVGSSIQVITKEFLEDIAATDASTLLQYTTNAEVSGTRGTYAGAGNGPALSEAANLLASGGSQNRVRGLAPADSTRDFFVTDIPTDFYNVDRIEIQRGPNSILFGLGSPAGIVNASVRNAEFRNFGSTQARFGSYNSGRGTLDLNQQLIPKVLAVRLDGLWSKQKFEQDPAFKDDKRYYGAVRFDPQLFNRRDFHTTIKAKYEHGDLNGNGPRVLTPNDSISPWFRPVDKTSLMGGMGKVGIDNGYDAQRTDGVDPSNTRGVSQATTVNYQPWLSNPPNNQQNYFLIDGGTNQLFRSEGGWVNTGGRNNTGGFLGSSVNLLGRRNQDNFYGLTSLANYASIVNLPLSQYGQYKNGAMQDPSVFDFYKNLIDGPNKWEKEKWNTFSIDLQQTGWNDRVGVQFNYDRQRYKRSNQSIFGYSPTISIDILKNFLDFYTTGASGSTITNPNFGRPYITSGAGGGGGTSYESERKYTRASLFGEIRSSDFLSKEGFLSKLLGRHRFNGVYADESYHTENLSWQNVANSREWAAYWNGTDGLGSGIDDRAPLTFVYLGSSVANRSSATGAYVPRVMAPITLPDSGVHVFNETWLNFGTPFNANWNVPTSLYKVFNGLPNPEATAQLTQASNPDNYIGWSMYPNTLMRYNNGQDKSLLRNASLSLRQTKSYAGSWQGFLWNESIVPTFGWRYDEVKKKDFSATRQTNNRNILNLAPDVYKLPGTFPTDLKGHSTSGGLVAHLNRVLGERDRLPINISLSYNESSNFQVTDVRRDIYGHTIDNPAGNTREYGVMLSTKDNKYSFRAWEYKTSIKGANTQLTGNPATIVQQGMRWRNVFLYKMGVYDWATREQWQSRNTWGATVNPQDPTQTIGADRTLTDVQGRALEDAAIRKWNEAQAWLTGKGFFAAWGFQPQSVSVLTDRSTYEKAKSSPTALDPASQYAPNPADIYAYTATTPQGFNVTADTASKGYEFEFVANPTPNWRIAFNASETTATRTNVGGAALDEYVNYIDNLINAPIGSFNGTNYVVGNLPQFGNTSLSLNLNVWLPFRGSYSLLKLQEGSAAPEIRKWRYNVVTNYTFKTGRLKGFGVGASYRWQDKVIIGYPTIATNPTIPLFDLNKPYYGPAEAALDLSASYERKISEKIGWKIQLNVFNVGKRDGLIPVTVQPDGRTWAGVRTSPVQEWALSNTFSF